MTRFMLYSPRLTGPDTLAGVDIAVIKTLLRPPHPGLGTCKPCSTEHQGNSVSGCGLARSHVAHFAMYREIILPQQPYQGDQPR